MNDSASVKGNVPKGYRLTDAGIIPHDWNVRTIGSFCSTYSGGTPSTSRSDFYGGDIPWIASGDLNTHRIKDVPGRLTKEGYKNSAAKMVDHGDLVLALYGATAGVVAVTELDAAINQAVLAIRPNEDCIREFLFQYLAYRQGQIVANYTQGGQPNLSGAIIRSLRIALPPTIEQSAIAEALSAVDGLLDALDQLIAKKQAIKQAAMQQLLAGKTRLPGFTGKWETKRIGEFTDCTAGGTPSTRIAQYWGGPIRWMNSGELNLKKVFEVDGRITERGLRESSTTLVPARCVLIGLAGQGKTRGTVAMNMVELCTNQSIAAIFPNTSFIAEYLYYNLDSRYDELRGMSTGDGGRGGLNLRIIRSVTVPFPPIDEQEAIATVLANMDAEIEALERRREKSRQIKQGMMQQLLTGRIRLVKPEPQALAAQSDSVGKASKHHSWAFNEAVVISTLAKHFGKEDFPLGRKRYTKLSYLLHRHAEQQAEGYLKKVAGPYNPKTKYGGPERIALESSYIREHKNGPYTGFVAADNIAQAEGYFEKWYGPDAIQWLNQFRFKKNDDLELLATVDMAAEELRAEDRAVDVDAVKAVIRSHPEWKAKLDRAVFSDENIAKAIEASRELFTATEQDNIPGGT